MKNINVLITHVSYQAVAGSFIKMLRNSKCFNFYIIGSDTIKKGYSSGSMLVDKFYHLPYDVYDPQYINFIKKICVDDKIDVILSAEEEDLITFKANKIVQSFYQYLPDIHLFKLFQDKHIATIDIQNNNFLVPKTIFSFNDYSKSDCDKFILRQRTSCCSRGIYIFKKGEFLKDYIFFTSDYIVQEFIDGEEYTVDVFCDKFGKLKMIIPRQDLSTKDGTTFKCQIKQDKDIIEICKKIYSIYSIPGISNIQFIKKNGLIYFIELNVRSAATLIASSIASINILDIYISNLLGDSIPDYETLMNTINWGSVISRYYEETIMYEG